jgi:hypothetical protein
MAQRQSTIDRQIDLEIGAAAVLTTYFPPDAISAVGSIAVVKARNIVCLDLQASKRPPSRRRLEQHRQLRDLGYRVATVRSVSELRLALKGLAQ